MICAVYKSRRKADTYLFIKQKDKFDDVPAALMEVFGQPQLVMLLPIERRQHLGLADINKVRVELQEKGYYLQLPPPQVNLLTEYLEQKTVGTKTE
ncbi:YcgL domain-containing protein [Shewanella yunxiaonensis]|uniref:YcgL domain-containing protein KDN34_09565 n=1 Tax=Shewanella yunxiaonensis TaxID=2829809 RepID=A0ABX7YZM3_9GAMM|nr:MULTISPECIES: YcgL domain-containing protein [Shewanella]MDF0535954.1 YcgL domain-containing protein [Shewanella sp. A32]QUN07596.1 YcgL domain-containing protein [Shewanella yunxiaonensis]